VADALIGHTGFVGSNLARQAQWDDYYNSANIESIAGKHYDLIVCAAPRADKWRINLSPEVDRAEIDRLTDVLGRVSATRMILISTVDVYSDPRGADELTTIDPRAGMPYGRHRLELERTIAARFETLVVRLPGLFGPGLKKNVIFDLLHDNQVDRIHAESVYQFYDLGNLWKDLQVAMTHCLTCVNFATEPVKIRELAHGAFGREFLNRPTQPPVVYDFRSRHASLFGGSRGYLYDAPTVLRAIARFVAAEQADRS